MSWLRLDVEFDSHPKMLALGPGPKGDARRWTWTRILLYTASHGSEEIPMDITEIVPRATKTFVEECINVGLADIEDGRVVVHDWVLYADVPIADKVAYWLRHHPSATANEVVKGIRATRGVTLREVARQRGSAEPLTAGTAEPGLGGSESGSPTPALASPQTESQNLGLTEPRPPTHDPRPSLQSGEVQDLIAQSLESEAA